MAITPAKKTAAVLSIALAGALGLERMVPQSSSNTTASSSATRIAQRIDSGYLQLLG